DVQLNLVQSLDDALALKTWLSEDRGRDGMLAFDTETTGLSPATDRVRLVQIGDANTGWAIPFVEWRGLVKEIIDQWQGDWVMHNAKYDVAMMDQGEGIRFPLHRVHDTRYMCHILNPLDRKSTRLNSSHVKSSYA